MPSVRILDAWRFELAEVLAWLKTRSPP